jgi:hypothetical protein
MRFLTRLIIINGFMIIMKIIDIILFCNWENENNLILIISSLERKQNKSDLTKATEAEVKLTTEAEAKPFEFLLD